MFVDLDWPLNTSSLLSASAELLVLWSCELRVSPDVRATFSWIVINTRVLIYAGLTLPIHGQLTLNNEQMNSPPAWWQRIPPP